MEGMAWNSFYCSHLGWLCWAWQEHPRWKEQLKHGSPVSAAIGLGGFSPWGHCLGVQIFYMPSVLSHFGKVAQYPIASFSLRMHPPLTAGVEESLSVLQLPLPWTAQDLCSAGALWSWKEPSTQHSCEGIDLPLLGEAKLVHFGMDLIPGGGSQIGGSTKNSCSDWDEGIGQWQKMTRIKAVSLTKWWLKRAKKMELSTKWLHGGNPQKRVWNSCGRRLSCGEVRCNERRGKQDVRRNLLPMSLAANNLPGEMEAVLCCFR